MPLVLCGDAYAVVAYPDRKIVLFPGYVQFYLRALQRVLRGALLTRFVTTWAMRFRSALSDSLSCGMCCNSL